jgi:hypothetical protein
MDALSRGQQTFSIKAQVIDILGFVGCTVPFFCNFSALFF